jgi:hypothetical protein
MDLMPRDFITARWRHKPYKEHFVAILARPFTDKTPLKGGAVIQMEAEDQARQLLVLTKEEVRFLLLQLLSGHTDKELVALLGEHLGRKRTG